MSLGLELELPGVVISADAFGKGKPKFLQYDGCKGLPLFRSSNRKIAGVLEYAGLDGPSLLELVTAPAMNPYQGDEWEQMLDAVTRIKDKLAVFLRNTPKGMPLKEMLTELNKNENASWHLVEESSLARYTKMEQLRQQGLSLPLDSRKATSKDVQALAHRLDKSLHARWVGSSANMQISFSTNLSTLGAQFDDSPSGPFGKLLDWCGVEKQKPEVTGHLMLVRFLEACSMEVGTLRAKMPDLLGFLYLVFHRLAAENIEDRYQMVSKNRFALLPRFNLRRVRRQLGERSQVWLASRLEQPGAFYDAVLEAVRTQCQDKPVLDLETTLSPFLARVHRKALSASDNTYGTFLRAVFTDTVPHDSKLDDVDQRVIDVEDTTHCPEFMRGWPNLVLELRNDPPVSNVSELKQETERFTRYDTAPTLNPPALPRAPRIATEVIQCHACSRDHGAFPSGPRGHWHICTHCYFVYCNVCGNMLRPASQQPLFAVRTTRACDDCDRPTELVYW